MKVLGSWRVWRVLKNRGVFASFVTFLKGETFTWMVWKALGVSRLEVRRVLVGHKGVCEGLEGFVRNLEGLKEVQQYVRVKYA